MAFVHQWAMEQRGPAAVEMLGTSSLDGTFVDVSQTTILYIKAICVRSLNKNKLLNVIGPRM